MSALADAASRHGWPVRLRDLTGWRRWLAAALAGAIAIFALPPAYATPLLWLTFPCLLLLLDGAAGPRQAFAVGWWFGFAHHLLGLYWISFALLLDTARFFWLMPFAAAGLPALLACFLGAAMAALDWASRRFGLTGVGRVLAFAVLWSLAEYLRGHVLTGFPWNLVAYGWIAWLPVFQTAALVGSYGLGLLTAALAALPYLLADRATDRRIARRWVAGGVALLLAAAGWGHLRLAQPVGMVPGVTLRLVQPNIEQTLKWDPAARRANFEKVLRLSRAPAARGDAAPTALLWPESAVPYDLEHDTNAQAAVAAVTPPGGLLLAGTARATIDPASGTERYWNSLLVSDHDGQVRAIYDKFHLVPFGEYVPLRRWLPLPRSVTGGEFSAGPGPRVLSLPGLPPVSPLICYEVIFPGRVKPPPASAEAGAADAPRWIATVTNDGWYGNTAGPHQHFDMARARAVEEGLPVVRVANTGISGTIDPYGRVLGSLALGTEGVLDSPLPEAAAATLYGRRGDLPYAWLLLAAAGMALFSGRLRRQTPSSRSP